MGEHNGGGNVGGGLLNPLHVGVGQPFPVCDFQHRHHPVLVDGRHMMNHPQGNVPDAGGNIHFPFREFGDHGFGAGGGPAHQAFIEGETGGGVGHVIMGLRGQAEIGRHVPFFGLDKNGAHGGLQKLHDTGDGAQGHIGQGCFSLQDGNQIALGRLEEGPAVRLTGQGIQLPGPVGDALFQMAVGLLDFGFEAFLMLYAFFQVEIGLFEFGLQLPLILKCFAGPERKPDPGEYEKAQRQKSQHCEQLVESQHAMVLAGDEFQNMTRGSVQFFGTPLFGFLVSLAQNDVSGLVPLSRSHQPDGHLFHGGHFGGGRFHGSHHLFGSRALGE